MATRKAPAKRTRTSKTVDDVVDSVTNEAPEDAQVKKVRSARKAKAISDSADVTTEKVAQSLTKAGLDITKTLNSVREMFESEIGSLEVLKEAIEAKQEELEELFDKEVVATSLRDLVLKYQAEREATDQNRQEARDAWMKEQDDKRTKAQEFETLLTKTRKQEQEEYEYNKRIARRNEEEAWKQIVADRTREQKATEEALEKTWKEREEALKKTEAEVNEQKDKLDKFDETVEAEVDKQVAIAKNAIKSQFEHSAQVKQLEFDKENSLLAHDNNVLKSLVAAKDAEIEKLRAALDKKDSEVKEVAVAAMEAQSGKAALAAVQEHAQSTSSGKK